MRMPPSSRLDAIVGGVGDDSAKRLRVRGVAKTPYVFYLFLRKLKRLWNVDIGREELDARRIRGVIGGGGLGGGFLCGLLRKLRRRRRGREGGGFS